MKKLQNELGFSAVELLLILVIVGIIGFVGWYVWHSKQTTNKTYNAATSALTGAKPTVKTKTSTPTSQQTSSSSSNNSQNKGYLVIPEWGIKVKLGNADPSLVMYTINNTANQGPTGQVASSAMLNLKSSVTSDSNCQSLGIAIEQGVVSGYNATGTPSNIVGKYYYYVDGSPYACDNASLNTIRQQYVGNNPAGWAYSSINN